MLHYTSFDKVDMYFNLIGYFVPYKQVFHGTAEEEAKMKKSVGGEEPGTGANKLRMKCVRVVQKAQQVDSLVSNKGKKRTMLVACHQIHL